MAEESNAEELCDERIGIQAHRQAQSGSRGNGGGFPNLVFKSRTTRATNHTNNRTQVRKYFIM